MFITGLEFNAILVISKYDKIIVMYKSMLLFVWKDKQMKIKKRKRKWIIMWCDSLS